MKKLLDLSKRKKFVLTSIILALGLLITQIIKTDHRYEAIFILSLCSLLFSLWCLWEGLSGITFITVLLLPPLYTAGVGLFYFLLPVRWLTRLPVAFFYAFGMYSLLLTENIFSVAAIRTIQLLRAAHAVGFLLTLITAFFLYDTILSFRFPFWINFFLSFLATFPLMIQGFWSVKLEDYFSKQALLYSILLSFGIAEVALFLSFWPVTVTVGSLFLTSFLYVLLGLFQHHLDERLFRRTAAEYISVGVVVFITVFLTTSWG